MSGNGEIVVEYGPPDGSRYPIYEDREMHVHPGETVITAWVDVDACVILHKVKRSIGDVERKYRRLLQMGDAQPFPPPRGEWCGTRFLIRDGAHEYLAALTLGRSRILVAWMVRSDEA